MLFSLFKFHEGILIRDHKERKHYIGKTIPSLENFFTTLSNRCYVDYKSVLPTFIDVVDIHGNIVTKNAVSIGMYSSHTRYSKDTKNISSHYYLARPIDDTTYVVGSDCSDESTLNTAIVGTINNGNHAVSFLNDKDSTHSQAYLVWKYGQDESQAQKNNPLILAYPQNTSNKKITENHCAFKHGVEEKGKDSSIVERLNNLKNNALATLIADENIDNNLYSKVQETCGFVGRNTHIGHDTITVSFPIYTIGGVVSSSMEISAQGLHIITSKEINNVVSAIMNTGSHSTRNDDDNTQYFFADFNHNTYMNSQSSQENDLPSWIKNRGDVSEFFDNLFMVPQKSQDFFGRGKNYTHHDAIIIKSDSMRRTINLTQSRRESLKKENDIAERIIDKAGFSEYVDDKNRKIYKFAMLAQALLSTRDSILVVMPYGKTKTHNIEKRLIDNNVKPENITVYETIEDYINGALHYDITNNGGKKTDSILEAIFSYSLAATVDSLIYTTGTRITGNNEQKQLISSIAHLLMDKNHNNNMEEFFGYIANLEKVKVELPFLLRKLNYVLTIILREFMALRNMSSHKEISNALCEAYLSNAQQYKKWFTPLFAIMQTNQYCSVAGFIHKYPTENNMEEKEMMINTTIPAMAKLVVTSFNNEENTTILQATTG